MAAGGSEGAGTGGLGRSGGQGCSAGGSGHSGAWLLRRGGMGEEPVWVAPVVWAGAARVDRDPGRRLRW